MDGNPDWVLPNLLAVESNALDKEELIAVGLFECLVVDLTVCTDCQQHVLVRIRYSC